MKVKDFDFRIWDNRRFLDSFKVTGNINLMLKNMEQKLQIFFANKFYLFNFI